MMRTSGFTPREWKVVRRSAQDKADLGLGALCAGLGLALRALSRSLEGAQTTHLVEDSLGVEFGLKALESAIDGFALTDNNFRHMNSPAFLE